ncbi:MAG: PepSY domain-containing protein [Nitrospirae bacterium]|nr:PepSY domain-containing protein [Nitrospirota bacterium]
MKITILVLILAVSAEGTCFSGDDHERARRLKESGDILPLEEIIKKSGSEHPGRILEVELEEKENRLIYELEILDKKGVVWKLYFDARTGELLKRKEDK